jgi:hypothetical protein
MTEDDSTAQLLTVIEQSGFRIVSMQAVIDALAVMEDHLMRVTGVEQAESALLLDRLELLVGKDEAMKMDLDEIADWIRAFKGH